MEKPTVTQLIDLLDKPALLKWANKIGLEGISLDEYRSKSKSDGSNVHKQIENDFKHGITYENDKFQAFKMRYEVIKVEPEIECDHYKGRADVLLKRNDFLWLFDFKNSDRIYFEQKLQLIAYKRVLNCHKVGIVHTSTFIESIVDITPQQEREYLNILGALTIIWKSKKALGL